MVVSIYVAVLSLRIALNWYGPQIKTVKLRIGACAMNLKKISQLLLLILIGPFLFSGAIFAQDIEYTQVFTSTDASQWDVEGFVTPSMDDGLLSFLFIFDDEHPVRSVPDTVRLGINNHIDLSSCSSAYVRFSKEDILLDEDSWIVSNIRIYAKHSSSDWVRVYEDISHLAGWVNDLELRFRVAVRTDEIYPGSFKLTKIRVEGVCG